MLGPVEMKRAKMQRKARIWVESKPGFSLPTKDPEFVHVHLGFLPFQPERGNAGSFVKVPQAAHTEHAEGQAE